MRKIRIKVERETGTLAVDSSENKLGTCSMQWLGIQTQK